MPRARELLQRRDAPVERALARGDPAVGARHHPRRACAGRRGASPTSRLDRGDELDRRRARADHGDAAAAQVVPMVPPRGVEGGAGERLAAGDVGQPRLAERALRGDQEARADGPARGLEHPAAGCLVPRGRLDRRGEADRALAGRARGRGAAGRRGSRAARRTSASSPGWARTRASRGGTGRRRRSRDTCWPTTSRRPPRGARARRSRRAPPGAGGWPRPGRRTRRR